ncbi:hypothetical protein niasHT_007509 [Heterodera trifolii]|uniref:Tudor domain-containing protein n=1 Tax=Heterodera trifolii TaxID=157864 RepID=A0ABD2LPD8_9BILA
MFNGGLPSSDSASNRRIATIIGLGGVSIVAVATTIWMYKKRNQRGRRNGGRGSATEASQQDQAKTEQEKREEEERATDAVNATTNSDESDKRTEDNENDAVGSSSTAMANEVQQQQQLQEEKETADAPSTAVETLVRNHISEPELTWSELVEQDELQQQQKQKEEQEEKGGEGDKKEQQQQGTVEEAKEEKEGEQKKKQGKKEQQQPTDEEGEGEENSGKKLKTEEEQKEEEQREETADEEQQMMLQQQHHHRNGVTSDGSRRTYAGRASIGSTGTASGGRQHPVNGICECKHCTEALNDLHSSRGYKNAESPNSTHSEGSADSGRATGHLTSYSPFADAAAELGQQAVDNLPIYEFEVPNTLVGLIIGIKGKTIKELCTRADVRMLIRPHHTQGKFDTHQLCSVEGRRDNINKCLHMIRLRFPPCRFPDLNLKPVFPPPLAAPTKPTTASTDNSSSTVQGTPTVLALPVGVPCEVYVSAHVDAGHFFVQLPTHPSFSSLALLDSYMLSVYTQPGGAPDLPKPCNIGVLCAAPAYNGWFRAITLAYDQDQDEMLVRFVDYGGFARLPRADLRQIRTDFVTLPLQGIECYLANVQPADGSLHWSDKANELFQQLCVSKIIQAALVGYCKTDGIPCVELFVMDSANKKTVRIDQILLERGLAKQMDPTLMVRTPMLV